MQEVDERAERKEKRRKLEVEEGSNVNDWLERALEVHSTVMATESAWPFTTPVTEDVAPGYFDVISDPVRYICAFRSVGLR